ncbi:MAG: ATP-grasp domain-containing protein [Flavobacterium sp.]|uniref:ATP-grasp domain-containing protein n=1 Tax=Flavobacterium sp. TaxID=239 RepID=UPI00262501F0|nr:ATP-grasp domain-containing protein [Flavobacterium sp.]MDD5149788.1 ATP-grasp domain-containing protein [Flavobacterium sp.]
MSVICWIQIDENNELAFDFCYSAKIGAIQSNHKVSYFINSIDIPFSNDNIIVGSVEMCSNYLHANNLVIPEQISIRLFNDFIGREVNSDLLLNSISQFPVFIKPNNKIKEFNAFVANKQWDIDFEIYHQKINPSSLVQTQDVIDILSEYRVYINNKKIIGCEHYLGDCLLFPDKNIIESVFDIANKKLNNIAYTLDFGILDNGKTILIEVNDGWAIGNYGIDSYSYYQLIKNRWFQIINGVRNE